MKYRNLLFDFTHTYPKDFKTYKGLITLDCSHLTESKGYCSEETKQELKNRIQPYGISGIHFLDSGDYHYISELMTDFIQEDFTLIVIDHHTDMQKALFDITSCGSWVLEVLKKNKHLQQLVLIGQEHEALASLKHINSHKLLGISYEELVNHDAKKKLESINNAYPVYLSIDKDVLDYDEARTNWDQGEMTLAMLEKLLSFIITSKEIIGIDICGDDPDVSIFPEYIQDQRINTRSDEELFNCIINLIRYHK